MKAYISGLLFCILIALLSYQLKSYLHLGAPLIALLIGALLNPLFEKQKKRLASGVGFAKKKVLGLAIVLIGFSINAGSFPRFFHKS